MASKRASIPAKRLLDGLKQQPHHPSLLQTRQLATHTSPESTLSETYSNAHLTSAPTEPILQDHTAPAIPSAPPRSQRHAEPQRPSNPFLTTTTCTLHAFPSLEPLTFTTYPSTHLALPLRKDILHRAVVYEGDSTRQGTASTKYRTEVHGSNRKIRPQKGTGSARLGDKKSPMLKGGGVAFGPKPRDFATQLPKRIYDLAFRIALSHRYRLGQLILLSPSTPADLPSSISPHSRSRYLRDLLRSNHLGHADGRTLFVTTEEREGLWSALEEKSEKMGRDARARVVGEVDVKDLLGLGRVVMEQGALERMLAERESDLNPSMRLEAWQGVMKGGGMGGQRLAMA